MTNQLTYKGYGRIYVSNEKDVQKVHRILCDFDTNEYLYYYPQGLITTLSKYPEVIYVGKFNLWSNLVEECKKSNIPIFIFDAGNDPQPRGYFPPVTEPLTQEQIHRLMTEENTK